MATGHTARLVHTATGALFLAGTVVCAASYRLSPESLKARADDMAYFGEANGFTASSFADMLVRVRILAFGLLALAVAAWIARQTVAQALGRFFPRFRKDLADMRAAWTWAHEPAIYRWTLCALVLMSVLIRLPFLFQPVRYDEAHSFLHYASRPLYVTLSYYDVPNNHVLSNLLMHITTALLGNHEWSLRLPAFIFAALMIPAAYYAVRQLYDRRVALLAAGLLASSSVMAEYATNGRGYTVMIALFLTGLALSARLVKQQNAAALTGLVVCFALGFHTIPLMLYPFLGTLIWLWLSRRSYHAGSTTPAATGKDILLAVPATLGMVALLYLPVFVVSGVDALFRNRYVQPLPWYEFTTELPASLREVWSIWHRDIPHGFTVLLLLAVLTAMLRHRRIRPLGYPLFAVMLLTQAITMICQRVVPPPRAFLFLLPLYLMSASAGIVWFGERTAARFGNVRPAFLPAGVLALSFLLGMRVALFRSVLESRETGFAPDTRAIAQFLAKHGHENTFVGSHVPTTSPLLYYFVRYGIPCDTIKERFPPDSETIVVVNEACGHDLAATIRLLTPDDGMPPMSIVPIRKFPSASLYRATPQTPGP